MPERSRDDEIEPGGDEKQLEDRCQSGARRDDEYQAGNHRGEPDRDPTAPLDRGDVDRQFVLTAEPGNRDRCVRIARRAESSNRTRARVRPSVVAFSASTAHSARD